MDSKSLKTVLFFAINTPGHMNTLIAIADKLKADHGYRTVFLILGPTLDKSIENHGHELIILEEAGPLEDYEISENEDFTEPVDVDFKEKCGRKKIKLTGYLKYENFLRRRLGTFAQEPVEAFGKALRDFKRLIESEVIDNHENLDAAIKRINPDLVIIDVFMVPPSILKLKDVPWVKLCSANPLSLTRPIQPSGAKPPPMAGFKLLNKEKRIELRKERPAEWEAMLESWRSASSKMEGLMKRAVISPLEQFYEETGCPPPPRGVFGHDSPYFNLYLFPKEIDYDQDDDIFEYPSHWFRCDSMMRKPMSQLKSDESKFWADRLSEAMKGKRDMVYFSLGSLASGNVKLMTKYIDIFKKDQKRLYVISKGPNGHKYELDSNNMIGGNYVPQTFFLERASLAIIHGGNNSVFECLYFGVPMIILPVFGDQNDNGQRIEDLGLGRSFKVHNCEEEHLTTAIDDMLSDETIYGKVRSIGEQMRSRDSSTKISRMLEKLLDDKHLEPDFIEFCRNKDLDEIQF